MAGGVVNMNVCSTFKLRNGLTGNYHYSYNLPLRRAMNEKCITIIVPDIFRYAPKCR